MIFRQFLYDETACASYALGCPTHGQLAIVDPHEALVEAYLALADRAGMQVMAVFETHVHADHVSGLSELVARTGATAYVPAGAGVHYAHHALADNEVVRLGNTALRAIATPGHAPAHHALLVSDHRRSPEPWLVLTGDALLIGDVGRPDLHAGAGHTAQELARLLHHSVTGRLLTLPDHLVLYPGHYAGSVCGRGLSGNPVSTIGYERRHNPALHSSSQDAFVAALLRDLPPAPAEQAAIVAANLGGAAARG